MDVVCKEDIGHTPFVTPQRECLPLVPSRHIEEIANDWPTTGTGGHRASITTDVDTSHEIDKQYKGEYVKEVHGNRHGGR